MGAATMINPADLRKWLAVFNVRTGSPGNGDVNGPSSSDLHELANYSDTTGKNIGRTGVTAFAGIITALGLTLTGFSGLIYADNLGALNAVTPAANSVLATNGSSSPSLVQTLPNAVQDNITRLGQIATDVAIQGAVVAGSALSVHGEIWCNDNVNFVNGGTVAITGLLGAIGPLQFTTMNIGFLLGDITGNISSGTLTGDVTSTANSFSTTIANNVISNAKFRQSAGLSVVGNATNATANVADITASANQILASGASSLSWTSTIPNAVQLNITALGTIATGVWNGTAINGSFINYNTTNLKVTANQLNTIQDIATTSNVSFNSLSTFSSNGGVQIFCNNTQTTFGISGVSAYARNSSAVVNNWMSYAFLTPAGNIAAAIACQMTAQTATEEGDLVLFARNNSSGAIEGARLIGNTNKFKLINPLDVIYGGNGFSSYSVGNMLYADTTTTLAKISPAASSVLVTSAGSIPSLSTSLPNGVQTNITSLGTVTTGTWHATAIDGTYINYNTTNLKVTSSQLNTIQNISTTSSPSFTQLNLSNSAAYTLIATTNNSSTSAITNATNNANALFMNTNTTDNNWMTLGFLKNDGSLSAILGCQMVSQSSGLSDIVMLPGNSSSTATEGLRISGSGYTKVTGQFAVGATPVSQNGITFTPSVSASSAIARGFVNTAGTLTAAANSDILVANEFSSYTFAKGALTGLSVSMCDIYCNNSSASGVGTITNAYGLRIVDAWALTATNKYSLYNASTDPTYFAGAVRIGSNSNIGSNLQNSFSESATSPFIGNPWGLMIQNRDTTNNNFGSIGFVASTGLLAASISCQFTTQASQLGDLVYYTRGSDGIQERFRMYGGNSFAGTMFVANAGVVPGSNPSGGGFLYSQSGAGKWRGSSGTVTTFGPANPHCPNCGTDFVHEWQNDDLNYGYLVVCMNCYANGANSFSRTAGAWDLPEAA